ncbi:transcription factor RFX3 [Ostrinia nubilalis]|uniref:transcription factor RFX3 n=1 Tax=Ostrinia nubilalis TaxID=29057 RepID=UPI0030825FB1
MDVSSTVQVEVNGESSGQSSPTTEAQHTYITVASEGGNGVNYHVQYVEPQELYGQNHQQQAMETLRTYPVYGVATVGSGDAGPSDWPAGAAADYTAYGVVVSLNKVGGDETEAEAGSPPTPPAPQPRMPPATVQWLLDHYETAEGVSLPRSTLYAHYLRHCSAHRLEPVNAASFGKLIRSVFLGLRTRRLGTRGNSKYHYYGIRAKAGNDAPPPPDANEEKNDAIDALAGNDAPPPPDANEEKNDAIDALEVREPEPEREAVHSPAGLAGLAHRQYLGPTPAPDPPALSLADHPPDAGAAAVRALRDHHRSHGVEFLEAVAALDINAVERSRRAFWRRLPVPSPRKLMTRRDVAAWLHSADLKLYQQCVEFLLPDVLRPIPPQLTQLMTRRDVAAWLHLADLKLYQQCVEFLLPDVLRPIPPQLTQAIRNFAKGLEAALAAGGSDAPAPAGRAHAAAAAALAAALRRYTSLNHLAQAARAVLTNHNQIQQMLADLNRVDFRVVREQAAWACSRASAAAAHRLEQDFKATLGRGATLEQWATWLENCVKNALAPHERRADYTARARRLLLDWSFYSSLVIRELTLRSAASFGSFHLLRLLYDEYVSYLIERRVAAHQRAPPISVMQRPMVSHPRPLVSFAGQSNTALSLMIGPLCAICGLSSYSNHPRSPQKAGLL